VATNSVLARLAVQISANTAEFTKGIATTQKKLDAFVGNVTKLAGAVGVAFGVQQVASFIVEISKLSGEADAVNAAFERLPNSIRLMQELKEATGGTVSELGLMKRAVQASNFDISLKALPRLLEFATLRAQQTGQSVDYLVDSIVTGIGRKSKLILDNLGISAVQLDEALGGASTAASSIGEVAEAVGRIAEQNLSKMAGFSENASTKTQRLSAEWENFRVELGRGVNEVGLMGEGIDALTDLLKNLTVFLASDGSSALWDYLRLVSTVPRYTLQAANAALEYANSQRSLNTAVEDFNDQFGDRPFAGITEDTQEFNEALKDLEEKADREGKKILILRDEFGKTMAVIKPFTNTVVTLTDTEKEHATTLESLHAQQKDLNDLFAQTDVNDKKKLQNIAVEIQAINKQIEALEKLKKLESADFSNIGFKVPEFGDVNFTEEDFQDQSIDISIKPEDIESLNAGIDAILGLTYAYDGLQFSVDNANESQKKFLDFTPLINNALSGLGQALGAAISGSAKFGDALLSVLGGVLVQLGEMLITAGLGVEAFKASLESLNGAVAIAAGVALVALGSAISGSIKGLGANPTSGMSSRSPSFSNNIGALSSRGVELRIGEPITFRIQGEDLVYVLNRQEQLRGRRR
jgi:hypothetical protein